jgi:hypothetical protein
MIADREEFAQCLSKFNKLWVWVEVWVDRWVHGKILLDWYPGTILFVDPWRKLDDRESDINNRDYDRAMNLCIKNIKWPRSVVLRGTSEEVSKLILDDSIDFVYIDAQHSYQWCLDDINYWFSKIRKWWVVSGHDYYNGIKWELINPWKGENRFVEDFGVKDAVDFFAKGHNYLIRTTKKWGNRYFIK